MKKINIYTKKLIDWSFNSIGSTRPAAIVRIGLVILIWTRWANGLILIRSFSKLYPIFSISFFVFSTLMLLGIATRINTLWTAFILLTMYYYFGFYLGIESWTHHHTYLLAFAILLSSLTPSGKSYSVDRWLEIKKADRKGNNPPTEIANLWGMRLIAVQLSAIYFWTAFDKLTTGFYNGSRLEQISMWFYFGSDFPSLFGFHEMAVLAAILTIALEFSLAFGLLFEKTRKYLVFPGLLLHAIFYVLLPVRTYSATMWLLYLAYFDANKVHQVIDKLQGHATLAQQLDETSLN
jgi:hypothetical protein